MEHEYIQVDGTKIHYLKSGAGKYTVLLIHGAVGKFWAHKHKQDHDLKSRKLTLNSQAAPMTLRCSSPLTRADWTASSSL